jgi:Lhr-like helicase
MPSAIELCIAADDRSTTRWMLGGRAQLVEYLAGAKAVLGALPTQQRLVFERFFDEAGDMHLVIHAPFGARINRAFGLALRKRFCRAFNFELQAAATEDAIVLSLGETHSFDSRICRASLAAAAPSRR